MIPVWMYGMYQWGSWGDCGVGCLSTNCSWVGNLNTKNKYIKKTYKNNEWIKSYRYRESPGVDEGKGRAWQISSDICLLCCRPHLLSFWWMISPACVGGTAELQDLGRRLKDWTLVDLYQARSVVFVTLGNFLSKRISPVHKSFQ